MALAIVRGKSGSGFEAEVTELRPNSILLNIDHPLDFREQVTIELLGTSLQGEVVFANDTSAAVTFPMSPEIFELIEAFEESAEHERAISTPEVVVDDLGKALAGGAGLPELEEHRSELLLSTLDTPLHAITSVAGVELLEGAVYAEVREDGSLAVKDDIDALAYLLTLLSERPVLARSSRRGITEVSLVSSGGTVDLFAASVGGGVFVLRPIEREAVEVTISRMKRVLDRFDTADLAPVREDTVNLPRALPDLTDVPVLENGNVVRFRSHEQYLVQYDVNLKNGAVVVKTAPLPAGTRKDLALAVPGAPQPVSVSAQVMFQGDGTLGFSIALNDALRSTLERLARNPASVVMVPPAVLRKPNLSVEYDGPLSPPFSLPQLVDFGGARPNTPEETKGAYLPMLSLLLGRELEVVLRVNGPEEEIALWIYHGRVVFAERHPEKQEDLIGRRLVQARAISRSVLDAALPQVTPDRPLGALLVEQGKIAQEALNRELRAQILARALIPATFTSGRIRVVPWEEPPIRSKLLPVTGASLIVELIRQDLRAYSQQELTTGLSRFLDRSVEIDLERIQSAYRLNQKELRFYQRIAQSSAPVSGIGTIGGAGQTEGLRLTVLACALGFATIGKATRDLEIAQARAATQDLLVEQLETAKEATHFEILGIHWSATQREIRRAYETERKKLMMRKSQGTETSKEVVQKLLHRLDTALRILTSSKERKEYRNSLVDSVEQQHAAEHLVGQAEIALLREEYEEALDLLDTSDELHPTRRAKFLRARLTAP